MVSATVAIRNAAGAAYPPPCTATGTLNSIAVSGAAPVTMQNNTDGRPNAPPANWPDAGVVAGAAGVPPGGRITSVISTPQALAQLLGGSLGAILGTRGDVEITNE